MTAKELKKKQSEIDAAVRRQAKKCGLLVNDAEPIYDGIADEDGYLNSKLKVAWILKEPYDWVDEEGGPGGGGWSIVNDVFLNHD